ncbi:MAG: nucleoside kinase [Clostridia bacterium]|nr:nucleoside kinase [Clostridia bacterium]
MKIELKHELKDNFLGVQTTSDLNKVIYLNQYPTLVRLEEAYADKRIVELASTIAKSGKRIILIAGPSSSGKTTFTKKLCVHLAVNHLQPLYLCTDDYFVNREDTPRDENGEYNFEDLDAVDVDLFNKNLKGLLNGDEVDLPVFDFKEGRKVFGTRVTKMEEGQPIVIEGIHALNDALTPLFKNSEKFKIYICPTPSIKTDTSVGLEPDDFRILRRISRDAATRGHSAEATIKAWGKVRAGEVKNIIPYAESADYYFNSSLIYEICVLKKHVWPLLQDISPKSVEFETAWRLMEFLRGFESYDDDSIVPSDSVLKEFIGGSLYVD